MLSMLRDDPKFYAEASRQASAIAKRFDSVTGAEHVAEIYKKLLAN